MKFQLVIHFISEGFEHLPFINFCSRNCYFLMLNMLFVWVEIIWLCHIVLFCIHYRNLAIAWLCSYLLSVFFLGFIRGRSERDYLRKVFQVWKCAFLIIFFIVHMNSMVDAAISTQSITNVSSFLFNECFVYFICLCQVVGACC